ncbi:hypothetical protein POM88_034270 [Heracleum sosnowskyi]|uniref:Uncharacterized protein n=1 Tax=Heracleum sosnowskyi TaxID=360622 RepID=A0AAD8MDF7_9APIA|nr:hypothetical protein POM88_034270 [Heracleum sosnowskyi]
MASTIVLQFPVLALLLSTMYFSLTVSRPVLDLNTHPKHHLSADSSTNLDQQSVFPALLSGNKSMPMESQLPSFLAFLRPVIFPLHFGMFKPTYPFPIIPKFPKYPPIHDNSNLPSKPSVPSRDKPSPPPMPGLSGSKPIAKHP